MSGKKSGNGRRAVVWLPRISLRYQQAVDLGERFLTALGSAGIDSKQLLAEPAASAVEIERRFNEFCHQQFYLSGNDDAGGARRFGRRHLVQALEKLDRHVYWAIVCRQPLAVFPWAEVDILSGSPASRYFSALAGFLTALCERNAGTVPEKFVVFCSLVKSPYVNCLELVELGEKLLCGAERASGDDRSFLLEQVVSEYRLRQEQYVSDRSLGLQAPLSVAMLDTLLCDKMRRCSEEFFWQLPERLLKAVAGLDDSPAVTALRETLQRIRGEGAKVYEFPGLQKEALLRDCLEPLRTACRKAGGEESLQLYRAPLLELARLSEKRLLELAADLVESDARNEHSVSGRLQAFEDQHRRCAALAAELDAELGAGASSVLAYWTKRRRILDWLAQGLEADFLRGLAGSKQQCRYAANRAQEIVAAVDAAAEKIEQFLADLPHPLLAPQVLDPIGASCFDFPNQFFPSTSSNARRSADSGRYSRAEQQLLRRSREILEISAALRAGEPYAEIAERFGRHLVDIALIREHLHRGERKELGRRHPEPAALAHLVEQRAMVDAYAQAYAERVELACSMLAPPIRKHWSPAGVRQELLLQAAVFELAWLASFIGAENRYDAGSAAGPSVIHREAKSALFPGWLQQHTALLCAEYHPDLHGLLCLRRPSLLSAAGGLEDIVFRPSLDGERYIERLASYFANEFAAERDRELLRAFEAFVETAASPYVDFLQSGRYPLYATTAQLFLISEEQAPLFDAGARSRLLEEWVAERQTFFYGTEQSGGWLAQSLLAELCKSADGCGRELVRYLYCDDNEQLMRREAELFVEIAWARQTERPKEAVQELEAAYRDAADWRRALDRAIALFENPAMDTSLPQE